MKNKWKEPEKTYLWSMTELKKFNYSRQVADAYDASFYSPAAPYSNLFKVPPKYWEGEPLAGKKIVFWTEQGVGDEVLQGNLFRAFMETSLVKDAMVYVVCSGKMLSLFVSAFPTVVKVFNRDGAKIVRKTATSPDPLRYGPNIYNDGTFQWDYQYPMLSLLNYVRPGRQMLSTIRQHTVHHNTCGLSWKSYSPGFGRKKNVAVADLLQYVPQGWTVRPLQYVQESDDSAFDLLLKEFKEGLATRPDLKYSESDFRDYDCNRLEDAVKVLNTCDRHVSISNYSVHLAGSLGIPTIMPLTSFYGSSSTIWYWGNKGNKTPWYPSVEIKRLT